LLTTKQGILWLHLLLMTDSLFFSCCTAGLALAILLLRQPRYSRIVGLFLVLVSANLLRPAAVGIVPPFLLVSVLIWHRSHARALWLGLAILGSLFANDLVQPIVARAVGNPDAAAGAMAGLSLTQSTAFLLTSDTPTSAPAFRDKLAAQAALNRGALNDAPNDYDRWQVLLHGGDDFLRSTFSAACGVLEVLCGRPSAMGVDGAHALRSFALETIAAHPFGMFRLCLARLWADVEFALAGEWLERQDTAFDAVQAARRISARWNDGFPILDYRSAPTAEFVAPDSLGIGRWADKHQRLINGAVAIACLCGSANFLYRVRARRLDVQVMAIGLASLGLVTYHGMLALGQTAFGRYSDAVAAWIMVSVGGVMLQSARGLRSFTRSRR
jgi:hypothetical protein